MRKADVIVGAEYVAKVSGTLQTVRIERVSDYGGWDAVNPRTGRYIRIRSAMRLRRMIKENDNGQ